jgi:hypothetical protein
MLHTLHTPPVLTRGHTSLSTLQGSLPFLFAAVLVRPAPAIAYLFLAARLGENALNHSGLDSTVIDVLTLKV